MGLTSSKTMRRRKEEEGRITRVHDRDGYTLLGPKVAGLYRAPDRIQEEALWNLQIEL